jgi:hypothetical protein
MTEPPELPTPPSFPSESKNWKVYLFEFLLLLMAVILGFFADNLREQYAERQQARAYVQSFYEDLKNDTTNITRIIRHEEEKIMILDVTVSCYDSVMSRQPNTQCLTMLIRNSILSTPFKITERTINQLMMGGFRLLDREDTDHVTKYIGTYQLLQDHESTVYQESQLEVRNSQNTLIDFRAFSSIVSENIVNNDANFRLPSNVNLLTNTERNSINRFFNELLKYKLVTQAHMNQLKRMKEAQVALIHFLKRKYELE